MAVHASQSAKVTPARATFFASVTEGEGGYVLTVATRSGDAKQFNLSTKADVSATIDLYMAQWEALPS